MNPVYWSFPESLWPSHHADYMERVRLGYDIMEKSSVVVCGLARNLGKLVRYSHGRLLKFHELFRNCSTIVYSNDNIDNTIEELNLLQSGRHEWFHIIEETLGNKFHGSVTTSERYKDMAYYRNKYLDIVKKSIYADYLIVLDLDILGGYSWDGLANSMSYFKELEATAIASNGLIYDEHEGTKRRLHYDSLAFRRLNHPEKHDLSEINLLCYHRGEPPIQVNSAFGGLCIYDLPKLLGYNPTYKEYDCDHVTLHNQITEKGGKIFLNPSQIVLYSNSPYNL